MTRILVTAALLGTLLLSGCALNSEVRTEDNDKSALIFGFFDMSEAPFELGCVRITQDEKRGIAYRQSCMRTFSSGVFFIEDAPAMRYHVPFFYAGGKLHMISSDEKDMIKVPAKSLYYLGTFKYKVVDRNLKDILQLKPEQYGLVRVKSPNETAVLKMVLEKVESPRWKQRIKARLAR